MNEVEELKATVERMRRRIMGNLSDLALGDYVEVRYRDGSGKISGRVDHLWPEQGQARVESGWCFHPGDEILVHRPSQS